MRKTLLIAGAALAASIISIQAQTVYSQNVVGYINQTIPAGSFLPVGGSLINGSDVNQTNGNINTTITNGLVSDVNGPPTGSNTTVYVWDSVHGGVATFSYFNAADATYWQQGGPGGPAYPAGFYDINGNALTYSLTPGLAVYLQNKFSYPITVTTVGTVFQGTNVTPIVPGFQFLAFNAPVSDVPNSTNTYGLPSNLTSSTVGDLLHNDSIYVWDSTHGGVATFLWFSAADATYWEQGGPGGPAYPAGFYDINGNPLPSYDYPSANGGFYLDHIGSTIQWTNSFKVQ
jgi:hypothetical protein